MDYTIVYKDVKSYFRRYVETDETEIGMLALYGTATHLYKDYQAFPILHITGDYETGKNRRLDLLHGICLNPIMLSDASLPSLFRSIAKEGCTIIIDEADSFLKYGKFENFLLAGYKKGGKISRAKKDDNHPDGFKPVYFEVYCPKIVVTREGIQSEPLNSRAITFITFPKSEDSSIPDILPPAALEEGAELKARVETLGLDRAVVDSSGIELGLRGRSAEIFDCIKDVASIYGEEAIGDLREFIERKYIPETRYNTMFSFHEDLIRVLNDLCNSGETAYLETLRERLENENDDYANTTVKRIGKVLRSLHFELDRDNQKTYVTRNSKLLDIWNERYLSDQKERHSTEVPSLDIAHEVDLPTDDVEKRVGVESVVESAIGESRHRKATELVAKALSRLRPRRRNR